MTAFSLVAQWIERKIPKPSVPALIYAGAADPSPAWFFSGPDLGRFARAGPTRRSSALLAECLGIHTSSIALVGGRGSPAKIVAVDGMDDEAIRAAFLSEKTRKSSGTGTRE